MTEIYGTLGPACAYVDTLAAMIRAGMTGIRLNLSHVALTEAAGQIAMLREAEARCGQSVRLMIDLIGPELRMGVLPEPTPLQEGQTVILGKGGLPVPALTLPYLTSGQTVLLDDGKILLEVLEGCGAFARAAVRRGGTLTSRKSLALPGAELCPPALTHQDLENLRHIKEFGVTELMQPFVRSREDLIALRQALDHVGAEGVRIFAKIENAAGLMHLTEFLDAADVIVIARGDLGNAMPLWELPAAQKRISAICRRAGKPFMVATQLLSSMEQRPVPTRAEVLDIFNAVLDGASAVIVTGETAVGRYPAEAIRYLKNTAAEGERWLTEQRSQSENNRPGDRA